MEIIAHRGASGYQPENTLASFQQAIAMGADMLELDVSALPSGEVIVIHDATVNRTTDGDGRVTELDYATIHDLDAGGGQHVPRLVEVLDLMHKRLCINIELKDGAALPGLVADIIKHYVAQRGWSYHHFVVSSFDHRKLKQFARLCPEVRLGILFDDVPSRYWAFKHRYNVFSANMNASRITAQHVHQAHKNGFKVYAYTVNTKKEAKRLRDLKVDGIFTNYPDKTAV